MARADISRAGERQLAVVARRSCSASDDDWRVAVLPWQNYGSAVQVVMHTVVELRHFVRRATACGMTEAERFDLVTMVASNPDVGDVMEATGGMRKLRFAALGRGKSGRYRVVTFFTGPGLPVFLITVFAKGDRANLTKAERNELAKLSKVLIETYRGSVVPLRSRPERS